MINIGKIYINKYHSIISIVNFIIMRNNRVSFKCYSISKGQHSLIIAGLKDKSIDILNFSFENIHLAAKNNQCDINYFQNNHKEIPNCLEQKIKNFIDLSKVFI